MRAGHTALWCHLTPHKHPKATLRQAGHVNHVPTVHLGLAPLKTAPASSPRGPARYMSTASPALCHGPDAFLDAHHSKHDSDPTTNQGQFRGAEHVSVVHSGLAPLKTVPEGCSRGPARYMSTASPALCRGLDGIFEVCHSKHGSDHWGGSTTRLVHGMHGIRNHTRNQGGSRGESGWNQGLGAWNHGISKLRTPESGITHGIRNQSGIIHG